MSKSKHSFAIHSEADLFEKLRQEFEDLKRTPDSSRHAINFAMTAWHLTDWMWGLRLKKADYAERKQLVGAVVRSLDKFRAYVTTRCPELGIMQRICNGSKHLKSDRGGIADTFRAGHIGIKIGEGAGATITKGEACLWVTDQQGETYAFADLAEKVLLFWESIIRECTRRPDKRPSG